MIHIDAICKSVKKIFPLGSPLYPRVRHINIKTKRLSEILLDMQTYWNINCCYSTHFQMNTHGCIIYWTFYTNTKFYVYNKYLWLFLYKLKWIVLYISRVNNEKASIQNGFRIKGKRTEAMPSSNYISFFVVSTLTFFSIATFNQCALLQNFKLRLSRYKI